MVTAFPKPASQRVFESGQLDMPRVNGTNRGTSGIRRLTTKVGSCTHVFETVWAYLVNFKLSIWAACCSLWVSGRTPKTPAWSIQLYLSIFRDSFLPTSLRLLSDKSVEPWLFVATYVIRKSEGLRLEKKAYCRYLRYWCVSCPSLRRSLYLGTLIGALHL